MTHPSEQLWSEVVRIGRHLHWSLDTVLDLEHAQRRRVLAELATVPAAPGGRSGGWA